MQQVFGTPVAEALAFDRRWRGRRAFSVRRDRLFSSAGLAVDVVPERLAKPFVLEHHYAGSFPAARLTIGLFGGSVLKGVCVISVPMNQRAIPKYFGLCPNEGAEIGRFVLDPEIGFNGESWFLSRAMKLLRRERPEIKGLVSYADPVERVAMDGGLRKLAHWGTIYQASNAGFAGRSASRSLLLARDGTIVSERSLSKIRNGERGAAYAERQLVEKGAPKRQRGESGAAWVRRIVAGNDFKTIRHPGNFIYLFSLQRDVRPTVPLLTFPKRETA